MVLSVRVSLLLVACFIPNDAHSLPGTFGKNFFQPDYEWGFMTMGTGADHVMDMYS
jgi:hypothetical protein